MIVGAGVDGIKIFLLGFLVGDFVGFFLVGLLVGFFVGTIMVGFLVGFLVGIIACREVPRHITLPTPALAQSKPAWRLRALSKTPRTLVAATIVDRMHAMIT